MSVLRSDLIAEAARGLVEEYLTMGPEAIDIDEYLTEYYYDHDDEDTRTTIITVRQVLDNLIDKL